MPQPTVGCNVFSSYWTGGVPVSVPCTKDSNLDRQAAIRAAHAKVNREGRASVFMGELLKGGVCRVEFGQTNEPARGESPSAPEEESHVPMGIGELPVPIVLPCECILGPGQKECPHGNRRDDGD